MRAALASHDSLLKSAVESNGGVVVKTTGDGIHAAFASPSDASAAALDAQRTLRDAQWPSIAPDSIRVRIGLHTGEAELREGDYYGTAVNRAARIMSIAHGGQVLVSGTTARLLEDGLRGGAGLLDLGQHRLKGLNRPAHIFQVQAIDLPGDFPPLRTAESQKGNLPEPLTNFIGRERELAEMEQFLHETRLLTLTGPGGTGKTRLSLEAGHRLQGVFEHGIWLAELAPLHDEALVPTAVASLFDLGEQPGVPVMESLTDYLRGKELLLILDNCEHLVSACARLAADLLPAAPRLTILASSREGLGVPGETTLHVPALSIPTRDIVDRDKLAQFEAVRLFVARARAAKPGFELAEANSEAVGQIVRRLNGIPLAIELAAARVRLLSPAQIAARLDDRFRLLTGGSRTALPRQQTLRALIDWSYDLLDEDEQWFLRQMSVFSGGWTLEAAEYVVESARQDLRGFDKSLSDASDSINLEGLRQLDAFDLLASLVNKSLVRIDDSADRGSDDEIRYNYLETIRQYARDRLVEAGESQQARTRHLNYFLQISDDGFAGTMESFRDPARLKSLEGDLDNLRVALDWSEASDPMAAIYLLQSSSALWSMLGFGRELRSRAELLLEAITNLPPEGEEAAAERRRARAFGLNTLAQGGGLTGGDEKAYAAAEEAAAIFRDDGSLPGPLANSLFWQAVLGVEVGQPEGYAAALECYEVSRTIDNHVLRYLALIALARWELIKGDTSAAAGHLAEASRLHTVLGIPVLIAYQAYAESMVNRNRGDFDKAHRVLAQGVEALKQSHHRLFANVLESEQGHTLRQSGDLAGALAVYRHTIEEWRDLGNRAAVANQLECFAFIAVAENLDERAARLFGGAEALRETLSNMMTTTEKEEYDADVAALREAMDPHALEEAWRLGREMDMDTAVAFALSL